MVDIYMAAISLIGYWWKADMQQHRTWSAVIDSPVLTVSTRRYLRSAGQGTVVINVYKRFLFFYKKRVFNVFLFSQRFLFKKTFNCHCENIIK